MITCPHCGKHLEDDVAFCIYCNKRIGRFAEDDANLAAAAAPAAAGTALVDQAPAAEGFDAQDTIAFDAPGAESYPASEAESIDDVQASGQERAEGYTPESEPVAYSEDDYANEAVAPAYDPVVPAAGGAAAGAYSASLENNGVPYQSYEEDPRLHPSNSFEQRMGDPQERRSGGKVIAGALIALLAAAGIGVGGQMLAGNNIFEGILGGGASSSSTESGSESESSSEATKDDKKSSSSSKSESSSSSVKTKRGATPATATDGSEEEKDSESASDESAGDSGTGSGDSNGDAGASGGDYYSADSGEGDSGDASDSGATEGGASGGASGGSWPAFSATGATATSISPTEGSTPHGPDLVLDGDSKTAWNTNGDGVGQSITIDAGETGSVAGISVMGGYNKISYRDEDLYYANARPKEVLVEYEGGSVRYTLDDSKETYQDIWFPETVGTSWIKLTIESVYPGDAYSDCCISEIKLL